MQERNTLYPIFLKTSQLNILVVGGGYVALEKLSFLLKSSPDAKVKVIAPFFRPETLEFANLHKVKLIKAEYHLKFLVDQHIVIATTDNEDVNIKIYNDCRSHNILVNLADNPSFCDFYMGGIVTKGHVKLAISTNGKSPTTAKRLRQFFEDVIPENVDDLVKNLNTYRKTIKGNFAKKVSTLNKITENLIKK
ncbi:precorrin-2 dehydrogenase/sirohydrochlorin ferrochelatase family protein [Flavobacteriaceae bacterium LMO-SS05]